MAIAVSGSIHLPQRAYDQSVARVPSRTCRCARDGLGGAAVRNGAPCRQLRLAISARCRISSSWRPPTRRSWSIYRHTMRVERCDRIPLPARQRTGVALRRGRSTVIGNGRSWRQGKTVGSCRSGTLRARPRSRGHIRGQGAQHAVAALRFASARRGAEAARWLTIQSRRHVGRPRSAASARCADEASDPACRAGLKARTIRLRIVPGTRTSRKAIVKGPGFGRDRRNGTEARASHVGIEGALSRA